LVLLPLAVGDDCKSECRYFGCILEARVTVACPISSTALLEVYVHASLVKGVARKTATNDCQARCQIAIEMSGWSAWLLSCCWRGYSRAVVRFLVGRISVTGTQISFQRDYCLILAGNNRFRALRLIAPGSRDTPHHVQKILLIGTQECSLNVPHIACNRLLAGCGGKRSNLD
jgi:hypothetical protein